MSRFARRLDQIRAEFARMRAERGLFQATLAVARHGTDFVAHKGRQAATAMGIGREAIVRGVLFVGYAEGELGLGQSFRGLLGALPNRAPHFAIHPFNQGIESRRTGPFMAARYDTERRYAVNVIEMAADQLPFMFRELGPWRTATSYNILRTYWELPAAPPDWAPLLQDIHEIWAPTRFVANAFRPIFAGPITVVPPCVEIGGQQCFDRAHFGMQDGRFTFVFSFDYLSHPARKNPTGVLRAFQAAFPSDQRVGLLIKSIRAAGDHTGVSTELAHAALADPRIMLMDRSLTRGEMLSLLRVGDCYVSLHRSEGFGLGMAEAMAFGTPVIGTDYSGSTDFLSERTGFPIPYSLRPVATDEYVAADGQVWAEPDLAAAADAMRQVFGDQVAARARARAGQAFIEASYGRETVGAIAKRHLVRALAAPRRRSRPFPPGSL